MKEYVSDEKKYNKFCLSLLIIFSIILLVVVGYVKPYLSGDGKEYTLQTEAILNHYSMDIRDEDFDSLKINYSEYINYFEYSGSLMGGLHSALNGKVYSAHYGGYAFFVLPAKIILKLVGANQLRCFQITNAILYIISMYVVYKRLNILYKYKLLLLLLLLINPALFYITWTHTEVFSFSFVVMSLVYFYNKEHKKSILLISIAAMQNPALIMYGGIIGIDLLVILYKRIDFSGIDKNRFIYYIKKNYRNILIAGVCYIPFFLPIIQTLVNFHKLNIVASVARDSNYILEKGIAYLFDLNLGIFPYAPIILILFCILSVLGLRRNRYLTLLNIIGLLGIFYVICNQRQINSGMNGIMRYNVWILPIMIFYIVINLSNYNVRERVIKRLLYLSTIITMCIFIVSGGFLCSQFSSLEFSPWAELVMKYAPSIYNPYHGIFISRTLHNEQYEINYPLVYADSDGFARKILIPEGSSNQLSNYLVRGSDNDIDKFARAEINSSNIKDYQYINLDYQTHIKIYNPIEVFNPSENRGIYTDLLGVYGDEGDFSWIKSHAEIALSKMNENEDIRISFYVSNLLKTYNADKDIVVSLTLNDVLVKQVTIDEFDKDYNIIISKDEISQLNGDGVVVEIDTNATFNPSYEGMSGDNRDLSIMLKYVGKNYE